MHLSPAELKRRIDYHRERERLLARDAANQRFLAEVSAGLGASLDLDELARAAVALPVPHLADAALLVVSAAGFGTPRASFSHSDPDVQRRGREKVAAAAGVLAGFGPIAAALQLKRAAPAPTLMGWPAEVGELLPRGVQLVLPVAVRQEPLGALALFAHDPGRLSSPDDVGLGEELARRLAIAVENARLYRGAEDAVRARDRFLAVASHEL
jgi:GAF domain-containing protein